MLRIRLSRVGKIRQPSYRVVVAEKESKRDGRIVESIGHYNPLPNPAEFTIKEDRALYWLSVGAQPSDAVRILLQKQGTMDRLARFHGGESLEALVSEYTGVEPAAKAGAAEAAAGAGVVATLVDGAKDAVEAVVDRVEDVVETVGDTIEDAVAAVIDTDEEE